MHAQRRLLSTMPDEQQNEQNNPATHPSGQYKSSLTGGGRSCTSKMSPGRQLCRIQAWVKQTCVLPFLSLLAQLTGASVKGVHKSDNHSAKSH